MQIFMSFYDGKLKQQICYSFTLLIPYMFFNPFNTDMCGNKVGNHGDNNTVLTSTETSHRL